jgi:nanoRNase/pAp phosphatase (c-di-AMP/oligoRNAs hydrolase)
MIEILHIEMLNINDISDMNESDCIIVVDAQSANSNVSECKGTVVACIDHHPTFIKMKYLFRDIRLVGACSSIIAHWFKSEGINISSDLATALIYGIKIDTDELVRGVKELDIDMYCMLYKIADIELINSLSMNRLTFSDLKAYGAAIQNIFINNSIGFAEIPFDCPDALIAMVSDFILDVDVVSVSVVYAKRKDGLKFSVRSKIPKIINAGKIIQKSLEGVGNGGGHPTMAGGFMPSESCFSLSDINNFIHKRFAESAEYFEKNPAVSSVN